MLSKSTWISKRLPKPRKTFDLNTNVPLVLRPTSFPSLSSQSELYLFVCFYSLSIAFLCLIFEKYNLKNKQSPHQSIMKICVCSTPNSVHFITYIYSYVCLLSILVILYFIIMLCSLWSTLVNPLFFKCAIEIKWIGLDWF